MLYALKYIDPTVMDACVKRLTTGSLDRNVVAQPWCLRVFFNNFIDVQHVPLQVILYAPVLIH
jgi:hypothetical protein